MKKIRIGIDIDDCVCNTSEMSFLTAKYYREKHGLISKNEKITFDNVFDFDNDEFFLKQRKYVYDNTEMNPILFAKDAINLLKKNGFEIYFITSRTLKFWNNNPKKYAIKWLKKHGFKFDDVYANVRDKHELCKNLNIEYMIDDSANFLKVLNETNIKTIMIKSPHNKNYEHVLNVAFDNWLDIYDYLAEKFNIKDKIIDL